MTLPQLRCTQFIAGFLPCAESRGVVWVVEWCGLDRDMILPVRFSATAAGDAAVIYCFRLWLLRLHDPTIVLELTSAFA